MTIDEILKDYPQLTEGNIRAAIIIENIGLY